MSPKRIAAAAATFAGVAVAGAAQAQSWTYQVYNSAGQPTTAGYVTLTDKGDGKHLFHLYGGRDQCWQSDVEAKVEKGAEATVIETIAPYAGCIPARFVVKNDGSGGERMVQKDGAWVNDGFARNLSLKN